MLQMVSHHEESATEISNSANDTEPCQSGAPDANALLTLLTQPMLTISMRTAESVHSQVFILNSSCKGNCICHQMRD